MTRRPGRRTSALLLVLILPALAALSTLTPPAPAGAQEPAERPLVRVVLDRFVPRVPAPGKQLRITGRLVNTADRPVTAPLVQLRVSLPPLISRGELAGFAAGLVLREGVAVFGASDQPVDVLDPGASVPFRIQAPLDDLGLVSFGVYAVTVEAVGDAGAGFAERVGVTRTFLPWVPEQRDFSPTRLAWVWPLVGTPTRGAEGVFLDDRTAGQLRPGGRLDTLLDAGADTSVTWVVDPELLEAAQAMADGYTVRGGAAGDTGGRRDGAGAQAADGWLSAVRRVLADADVVALPYADPDAVALERAGLDRDLTLATTLGPQVAAAILERPVTDDVAWPVDGWVDEPTLDTLRVSGAQAVLLGDRAVPQTAELTYTPSGTAELSTIGGPVTAVLADTRLGRIVAAEVSGPGRGVRARQRFLAETAMITAERPSDPRTVLVAPPRRWDPDPDYARWLLAASSGVPWLEPVGLGTLRVTPAPDVARAAPRYPRSARAMELPQGHLAVVRRLRADLRGLASMLADPAEITERYDRAILRSESSAGRDAARRRTALVAAVGSSLADQRRGVRILNRGRLTLSGATGRLPVTIANDLEQAVTVRITIEARPRVRLRVDEPDEVTIAPERKETVEVPARATANGLVTITAQLETPDGQPLGAPVELQVLATDYGRVGYVVVGGALLVLLLTVGVRLFRRARAAAGHQPADRSGPG